ncbi:MAG: tetratricopeptide repeat protein, partial [Planctomycetota bacterium]
KRWGWAAAWVWLWLAPTSSVLPIITEVAADRRMYLPLAVVLGLLSVGVAGWAERRSRAPVGDGSDAAGWGAVWAAWGVGGLAGVLVITAALGSAARLTVYADRVSLWEDAIAKDPGSALAWNALANAWLDRGELDRAAAAFEGALERDPGYWKSLRGLGMIAASRGLPEGERGYEQRAMAARLERVLEAEQARRMLDPAVPEAAYRVSLERVATAVDPQALDIMNQLGGYWVDRGDLDRAALTLRRATDADASRPGPWASLGAVALRSGRPAEAVEMLDRAAALGELDSGGATTMGLALIETDRPETAAGWLRRAVAMDPRSTVAWRGLSTAMRRQGEVDEALRAAEQAVAVGGNDAGAWNSLGIAWASVGNLAEAEKAWRIALQLDPDDTGVQANLDKLLQRMGGSAIRE